MVLLWSNIHIKWYVRSCQQFSCKTNYMGALCMWVCNFSFDFSLCMFNSQVCLIFKVCGSLDWLPWDTKCHNLNSCHRKVNNISQDFLKSLKIEELNVPNSTSLSNIWKARRLLAHFCFCAVLAMNALHPVSARKN